MFSSSRPDACATRNPERFSWNSSLTDAIVSRARRYARAERRRNQTVAMTSGGIIPFYFIAGLALNKKPDHLYVDNEEQKYWQRVRQSPARTAREVRARFRDIDRRLAEVETYYVTSNPRLSAEIERLR